MCVTLRKFVKKKKSLPLKKFCSVPNAPISLVFFLNNKIMPNRVSLHFQQINIPESTSKVILVNTSKVMLKILQARL